VALAPPEAPFGVQITVAGTDPGALLERLVGAGARAAEPAALELARILAGWPGLATDVDEKTIPQEVRFDEIAGVSYTKGCYTGQETVSRLHFRGHANRQLRGLLFDAEPLGPPGVVVGDREVGRVTGIAWLPAGPHAPPRAAGRAWRCCGASGARRERARGERRGARGRPPFALPYVEPA
jgi:folate-binding protein YgfZ